MQRVDRRPVTESNLAIICTRVRGLAQKETSLGRAVDRCWVTPHARMHRDSPARPHLDSDALAAAVAAHGEDLPLSAVRLEHPRHPAGARVITLRRQVASGRRIDAELRQAIGPLERVQEIRGSVAPRPNPEVVHRRLSRLVVAERVCFQTQSEFRQSGVKSQSFCRGSRG